MRARAQGKGVEGSVLDPLLAILVQVSRCAAQLHQSEIHRLTESSNPWLLSLNESFLKTNILLLLSPQGKQSARHWR